MAPVVEEAIDGIVGLRQEDDVLAPVHPEPGQVGTGHRTRAAGAVAPPDSGDGEAGRVALNNSHPDVNNALTCHNDAPNAEHWTR